MRRWCDFDCNTCVRVVKYYKKGRRVQCQIKIISRLINTIFHKDYQNHLMQEEIVSKMMDRISNFSYLERLSETIILLEKLIANKNKCTEAILSRCIEHNRNTYVFVKEIVERQIDYYHRCYFDYFKDGNIISVLDSQRKFRDDVKDGIVTNIIKVNSQSDSFVISNLIHELNKCFDDILALNPEKGEKNAF